jgi:hypothetical protein
MVRPLYCLLLFQQQGIDFFTQGSCDFLELGYFLVRFPDSFSNFLFSIPVAKVQLLPEGRNGLLKVSELFLNIQIIVFCRTFNITLILLIFHENHLLKQGWL